MSAGAGQIMLKGAGALPKDPVVMAGCGPLLYLLAWQYIRAGAQIAAVVDTTPRGAYWQALRHTTGALAGWRDLAKGLKLLSAIRRAGVRVYSAASSLKVEVRHEQKDLVSKSEAARRLSLLRSFCSIRAWFQILS